MLRAIEKINQDKKNREPKLGLQYLIFTNVRRSHLDKDLIEIRK